ncbi:2Fe-2S iron-sulfur cluster binding domain [Musa troglodytarum]|uniref:2Fe-2S iron-sulfur cluster binding domain n=1 Tax=Musa troglodytarum TaxID=320322 RepID=A0A9E7EN31_9LILI|nr:2Fe-2S iron-sulfur cluster binding domain [Musa troglodytarum]
MGLLQFNSHSISSIPITSSFNYSSKSLRPLHLPSQVNLERRRLFAISTNTSSGGSESTDVASEEPPSIDFAFVNSKLLPDGTPDVQYRSACGGQKLRDIMLDNNIDLYGPYDGPLLNCSGGGTCGTCIVEVVEGKEILSLRTDREKELLKKKPKTWRLACQTMVGNEDSRGQIIIQQLPEWKVHEWEK